MSARVPRSHPASERPVRTGLCQRVHAWALSKPNAKYEREVSAYKRRLLGELRGDVLEIGPGAGANLPYYSADIHWTGIEPNLFMHSRLRNRAETLGLDVELRTGTAERLGIEGEAVDAVVSTLVLCSVTDVGRVLREILRVLRPGGRYGFVEHVAAAARTRLRRLQGWVSPVWKLVGDGCHPDRETWAAIEQAGLESASLQHFRVPFPIVGPHIAGFAAKKGDVGPPP